MSNIEVLEQHTGLYSLALAKPNSVMPMVLSPNWDSKMEKRYKKFLDRLGLGMQMGEIITASDGKSTIITWKNEGGQVSQGDER